MPWTRRERRRPSARALEAVTTCLEALLQDPLPNERIGGYMRHHLNRIAFDVDYVAAYAKRQSAVLDIGCAPPLLSAALLSLGYDVTGVDINPDLFARSYDRLNLTAARCDIDMEPLPFPDDRFDTVILSEVFEHLRMNPIATLREMSRVLKPGGVLLLSTPNLRSIGGLRNFVMRAKAYSCSPGGFPAYQDVKTSGYAGHIREYTATEMLEFFKGTGFTLTGMVHRGRYTRPLWNLFNVLFPGFRPVTTYVATKPADHQE
jgi:SAM-dependent methyltransferase